MTRAYVRDDLIEAGEKPAILMGGAYTDFPDEWQGISFECLQPDEWDEREWNLILVHPRFGVFYGQSIDFNYAD